MDKWQKPFRSETKREQGDAPHRVAASRGGGERVKAQSDFPPSAIAERQNWHPKINLSSMPLLPWW
jgi:hypothetical protein